MKSSKPATPRTWSYGRAFFLTLGLVFLGIMALVWIAQGHESKEWAASGWILFWAVIAAGTLSCGFGIAGSNKAIKKGLDSCGMDDAAMIIAIIAAPVYWIGQVFERPRRKR